MPEDQIDNRRNLDAAAFCDVQHVTTKQADDVALVSATPRRKAVKEGLWYVSEAVLLNVLLGKVRKYSIETAKLAGKVNGQGELLFEMEETALPL